MFAMPRQHSSSSSSSSGSSLSLSPSGWNPSRSTVSEPSTTTTPSASFDDLVSLLAVNTPSRPALRRAPKSDSLWPTTEHSSYAYPHWPVGDSLGATSSRSSSRVSSSSSSTSHHYAPPSSRISDDDLEGLVFASRRQEQTQAEEAVLGISWSQVGTGAAARPEVAPAGERRRRLPPPPTGMLMERSESRGVQRRKQLPRVAE